MTRYLRGVAALLVMAAVLLGSPMALLAWGSPVPTALRWSIDDATLLLFVLTVVGWIAWGLFVLAAGLEVVKLASGRRFAVNLPLLGALQAVCATLIVAVIAMSAVSEPRPAGGPGTGPEGMVASVASTTEPASAEVRVEADPGGPQYVVVTGDDLWSIAERELGDGGRWRDIAALNPEVLSDPSLDLAAGLELLLPSAVEVHDSVPRRGLPPAEPPESGPEGADAKSKAPRRVVVAEGDTLSAIALREYGRASAWPRIAQANPARVRNPDHIEPGWSLRIPVEPTDPALPEQMADGRSVAPPPTGPAGRWARDAGVDGEALAAVLPIGKPTSSERRNEPAEDRDDPAVDSEVGALGAVAASGIIGGWQSRRLLQARTRPLGRRVPSPPLELDRMRIALGRGRRLDQVEALERALRTISWHCHERSEPVPELAEIVISDRRVRFAWAGRAGRPPWGFVGDEYQWIAGLLPGEELPDDGLDHPCAFPALVTLGSGPEGAVLVSLERGALLGVEAGSVELAVDAVHAMCVELASAPWAQEISLAVVGRDTTLVRTLSPPGLRVLADVDQARRHLVNRRSRRLAALLGRSLPELRTDPDLAEAVRPEVMVFLDPMGAELAADVDDLLAGVPGLGAVGVTATDGLAATWDLDGDLHAPMGRLRGRSAGLVPQLLPADARRGLSALLELAASEQTAPAPWWSGSPEGDVPRKERDVDLVTLRRRERRAPTLLMIGPLDLLNAAGVEPARARSQLLEMCGWILEHPGQTASRMAAELSLAESTRRSNLSRLRAWLGEDGNGDPFLPDAYSGRIRLLPQVSSDARELTLLVASGVDRTSDAGLVESLGLVRGGVLADVAPSQWFWADELRSDLVSILRDAGLVLVSRALGRRDLDLARWAAQRALVVAPDDELLLGARIRTELAAGNHGAVERLVGRLTEQARQLGVDLLPGSVELCQQAMEGRSRPRLA